MDLPTLPNMRKIESSIDHIRATMLIAVIQLFLFTQVYALFHPDIAPAVKEQMLTYLVMMALALAYFKGRNPLDKVGVRAAIKQFVIWFTATIVIMSVLPLQYIASNPYGATGLLLAVVLAVIIAVPEELIFRGILDRQLSGRLDFNAWHGMLVANITFALFHLSAYGGSVLGPSGMPVGFAALSTNTSAFVFAFLFGMLMSIVYRLSPKFHGSYSIVPCIAIHTAFNFVVLNGGV